MKNSKNLLDENYVSPTLVEMSEIEQIHTSGGAVGLALTVFIVAAAVTVAGAVFIVGGGVGWLAAVGTTWIVAK